MPPGAITNFGTFDKNLHLNIDYVDGYPVLGKPKEPESLGKFIFNAIIDEVLYTYGGGEYMDTVTMNDNSLAANLARLASFVANTGMAVARLGQKTAKAIKVTGKATKTSKAANRLKTALPKTARQKREEIYKAQGYKEYKETKEEKAAFNTLHEIADNNDEFAVLVDNIYSKVKNGTETGIKKRNERLKSPNSGQQHIDENEKFVFNKNETTEEYKEPEITSSKDFYYQQDLEERERVRRWRAEGKLTFAQPTYTKEEKLANEERQAIIDRQNKLLAMQLTGRDENWNYILPTKENLTPKVNTPPNTQVNTQPNTQVNTQPNTQPNTQVNTQPNTQPNTQVNTQPNTQVNTQPNTRTQYQSDYTQDNRDYNNFNFGNNRPIIDYDWLNVNSNNVNNIDSEKLQNFVENE